ncbi:lipase [Stenotrophomonas sp. Betaine-02u-21]|uniref:XVIPCD domain-containing protein n=1 Tax=unclassified Stenotrophomonas TaxID=196198 RepID=UPI000C331884|nr:MULTISPECIES: XVIPCD domain-containing protein [unclassified Stenotrophomonas]PKH70362.1 lipase [Stenotrophomonas sp. Betaine-02u-23]PKH72957.1 lipase [Stenotrophomonas sp. Betaine-02u-21]PKH96852.1 lipase [Stenotrophomonas sp. Bg11-02]
MSLRSQDYAALADDAYKDRAVGRWAPEEAEVVPIGGHDYRILEHVNNKNGYQGFIYQRVDTNEIVVAHRGTEQPLHDVVTDLGMVVARTNLQADDAIALTARANQFAQREETRSGQHLDVTVTGHSLGGSLAQISAHHHGLKGETFNAYGAASLGYRIPEGGNAMVNHVMSADPVSAASGHYGQVKVYANETEINNLYGSGFRNGAVAGFLIPDSALLAAGRSLDSHMMTNFLDKQSVLDNPASQALAKQNEGMISEYRDKLEFLRGGLTTATRGGIGNAVDIIDRIRGPLDPGEPARKAAEEDAHKRDGAMRMDSPGHPGNLLFQDALRGVEAQDLRVGRTPDQHSGQLAGSLAAEMHANGGTRIDNVLMSNDASRTFGVQGEVNDPAHLRVSVETTEAMNTSLDQSSERVASQQAAQQVASQERDLQIEQSQVTARSMNA